MSHSPEPWVERDHLGERLIHDSKGLVVFMSNKSDRDRAIACVNACRGLPSEVLLRVTDKCIVDVYKTTLQMALDAEPQAISDMIALLNERGYVVGRQL